MPQDRFYWYKSAVQLRGSVLPAVLPRAILCGLVGVLISIMHYFGWAVLHLKQLILLYCLSLPFQMVKDFGLLTGLIVAVISFTLLGIEEIGVEIENPFGYDANDLPLDTICANMRRNIEDLISLAPSVRDWQSTKEIPAKQLQLES
jgi:predicted membrane chloride channel (bestrophin family)